MSFWNTDCESMFEGNCLLTQESLHSCLSTPMLWLNGGEVWPAASHGPGTGPPDIQRGQPPMKSAQILARNLSCVKCLGDVGAGRPHMITSWHQRMKLGWIGCKVAALLNFLFWLASCNVLVFMLWIILHCDWTQWTQWTQWTHTCQSILSSSAPVSPGVSLTQENIYWPFQTGHYSAQVVNVASDKRFMASDTDTHDSHSRQSEKSRNNFQLWRIVQSSLAHLPPWFCWLFRFLSRLASDGCYLCVSILSALISTFIVPLTRPSLCCCFGYSQFSLPQQLSDQMILSSISRTSRSRFFFTEMFDNFYWFYRHT